MNGSPFEQSVQTKPEQLNILLPDPGLSWQDSDHAATVVALRSDRLGDDALPESLGRELMRTLLKTLAEGPVVPQAIVLYGQAVNLAQADHFLVAYLQHLERRGSDILCCRISHTALQSAKAPEVGHLVDWIDILACFDRAAKVLWP